MNPRSDQLRRTRLQQQVVADGSHPLALHRGCAPSDRKDAGACGRQMVAQPLGSLYAIDGGHGKIHEHHIRAASRMEMGETIPLRDLSLGQPLLSACGRDVEAVLDGASFLPLHFLSLPTARTGPPCPITAEVLQDRAADPAFSVGAGAG
jgi:hypothetical protein